MKFWKLATLIALAAVPLLILGIQEDLKKSAVRPENEDLDNIFDQELTAD